MPRPSWNSTKHYSPPAAVLACRKSRRLRILELLGPVIAGWKKGTLLSQRIGCLGLPVCSVYQPRLFLKDRF